MGAFDKLKNPDLMALAQYLDLDVKHAMRKQEIKSILSDRLVDDDFWMDFVYIKKLLLMMVRIMQLN